MIVQIIVGINLTLLDKQPNTIFEMLRIYWNLHSSRTNNTQTIRTNTINATKSKGTDLIQEINLQARLIKILVYNFYNFVGNYLLYTLD